MDFDPPSPGGSKPTCRWMPVTYMIHDCVPCTTLAVPGFNSLSLSLSLIVYLWRCQAFQLLLPVLSLSVSLSLSLSVIQNYYMQVGLGDCAWAGLTVNALCSSVWVTCTAWANWQLVGMRIHLPPAARLTNGGRVSQSKSSCIMLLLESEGEPFHRHVSQPSPDSICRGAQLVRCHGEMLPALNRRWQLLLGRV